MTATIDVVWGVALIGFVITLWLASLGAVWKVATLLNSITNELKELRADTEENTKAIAVHQGTTSPSRHRSAK